MPYYGSDSLTAVQLKKNGSLNDTDGTDYKADVDSVTINMTVSEWPIPSATTRYQQRQQGKLSANITVQYQLRDTAAIADEFEKMVASSWKHEDTMQIVVEATHPSDRTKKTTFRGVCILSNLTATRPGAGPMVEQATLMTTGEFDYEKV